MAERLISMKTVRERTSLSPSQVHRLVRANRFPRPIRITERRMAWIEGDVDRWISEKIKTQDDKR